MPRLSVLLAFGGCLLALTACSPRDSKKSLQPGIDAYNKGNYPLAVADFSQIIQLDPNNAKAFLWRGAAYNHEGEYERAVADLSQAILLDPKFAQAYTCRGYARNELGENDKAIADLSQAILLNPNDELAYANRSAAYSVKGEYDKVIADASQAIQLDPNLTKIYVCRGSAYSEKGDYDKAILDCSQAILLNPEFARAYNNFAWLMATCPQATFRDGRKAVEYATKACDLTQWKEPFTLGTLAAACAEAGDFENAVKWENQQLATPGLNASDIADAQKRLALYQARQPYHTDK